MRPRDAIYADEDFFFVAVRARQINDKSELRLRTRLTVDLAVGRLI